MARARNIKPAIMDNEDLADLEPLTRLLFVYLWMLADRDGRMEDRPKRIAARALPYDRAADVDQMLSELHAAGFINRYQVNGFSVIQISAFLKHQTPHGTEKDGTLPDENGLFTVNKRGKNGYATGESTLENGGHPVEQQEANCVLTVKELSDNTLIPDSLIPDSLIPDSLIPDSKDTPSIEPVTGKPAPPSTRGTRIPQDWVLPKTYGDWALCEFVTWTPEIVRVEANKFRDHWLSESGAKARKVDWFATWRKWCSSDIAQRAHTPQARGSPSRPPSNAAMAMAQACPSIAAPHLRPLIRPQQPDFIEAQHAPAIALD